MNLLEKNMIKFLIDLKENHHVVGVKAEFGEEGTRFEEAFILKKLVAQAGLDLTIKIGGCEAIRDLLDAKTLNASGIVAPMIETPYAMKKYVDATQSVFSEEERKEVKFLINTETITGYSNLNDTISSEDFAQIDGIVLGRTDMTCSMGLTREDINFEPILNIAKVMSEKLMAVNKEFVIGGGVSTNSLAFFKQLPYLNRFETRKIIFDAPKALADPNADKGILKAIDFEIMWLKYKQEYFGNIFEGDNARIQRLKSLCKVDSNIT